MTSTQPARISATVASRRGVGFLTAEAQEQPLQITSHGKTVAVILSAQEYDEQRRALREAEFKILEIATNLVADRSVTLTENEARAKILAAG